MVDCQFGGGPSRAVKCLDRIGLGIVEQAESIPGSRLVSDVAQSMRFETDPPIPQQLGSVTLRAAEVATAASAGKIVSDMTFQ